MDAVNFCYWLQGFFELGAGKDLTPEQVTMIKEHLQLVFKKVTGKPQEGSKEPSISPVQDKALRDLIEGLLKPRDTAPTPPPYYPGSPANQNWPRPWWEQPGVTPPYTVTCSAGGSTGIAGAGGFATGVTSVASNNIDCAMRGTSDANLDNDGHFTVQANSRPPGAPIFIC